jgi:rare lipoprotein A
VIPRAWAGAAAGCLLLASACAHPARRDGRDAEGGRGAHREEGLASYYARSLEGRRTASGARYDGRAMTCAHPSLPFGTEVRVTDSATGKSVRVRVTDRGPFVQGRIVDLSWAAARELGILERGLARVILEVVRGD